MRNRCALRFTRVGRVRSASAVTRRDPNTATRNPGRRVPVSLRTAPVAQSDSGPARTPGPASSGFVTHIEPKHGLNDRATEDLQPPHQPPMDPIRNNPQYEAEQPVTQLDISLPKASKVPAESPTIEVLARWVFTDNAGIKGIFEPGWYSPSERDADRAKIPSAVDRSGQALLSLGTAGKAPAGI